jgi:hypothetical protein
MESVATLLLSGSGDRRVAVKTAPAFADDYSTQVSDVSRSDRSQTSLPLSSRSAAMVS